MWAVLLALAGGFVGGIVVDEGARTVWWYVRPVRPEPRPEPVKGNVWLTLVYDSDAPGLEFARVEENRQEIISAIAPGHLREFTKDSAKVDDLGFRPFVAKYGTPTLILQADGSAKVSAMPCPKSAAEVIAEAKKFRGHK